MSFEWDPSRGYVKSATDLDELHWSNELDEDPASRVEDFRGELGPPATPETPQRYTGDETKSKPTGSVRFSDYVETTRETTDPVTNETICSSERVLYTDNPLRTVQEETQASSEDQSSGILQASGDSQASSKDAAESNDSTPRRWNIDDAINELSRTKKELPRLDLPSGDTLVYIDAPPKQADQDAATYLMIQAHFALPFRMSSQTLRSVGSAYLEGLLGPTTQFRVLRRRNLLGKLPQNIKFVIDLTPSTDEDDAIISLMRLSCPMGVRQWGLSALRWRISGTLVGGYDEFTSPANTGATASGSTSDAGNGDLDRSNGRPIQIPVDYTQLRHRFTIERVLTAMEGLDPMLDSAVKVYTTCAVAEQLGIKYSQLTDYVVRWLSAPPNTYFREVFPEVTLRIAECLQVEPLCRDVFALLVGEAALDDVTEGRFNPKHSVHGRNKGDLPETWVTRIQYARSAFVDRIKSEFGNLVSMEWLITLSEFRKLSQHVQVSADHTDPYSRLQALLMSYVRGAIYCLLCSVRDNVNGPATPFPGGEVLFPDYRFGDIWNILQSDERCFTRTFWEMLRSTHFNYKKSNFDVGYAMNDYGSYASVGQMNDEATGLKGGGVFTRVDTDDLRKQIAACCALSHSRSAAVSSPSSSRSRISLVAYTPSAASTAPTSSEATSSSSGTATLPYRTIAPKPTTNTFSVPASTAFPYRVITPTPTTFLSPQSSTDPCLGAIEEINAFFARDRIPARESLQQHTPDLPGLMKPGAAAINAFFCLDKFLAQVGTYLSTLATQILSPPSSSALDLSLTNTLICLQEGEMKFLPLWAGGNDDDSAGVFNDDVPISDMGFSTAGPKVRTEGSVGGSTGGSSEWDMLGRESQNTSTVVRDGWGGEGGWEEESVSVDEGVGGMGGVWGGSGMGGMGRQGTVNDLLKMQAGKGKGKEKEVEEDNFEDVFMEDGEDDFHDSSDDDFDDDDQMDDGDDQMDGEKDKMDDEDEDMMQAALHESEGEKNTTIVYRSGDADGERP